MNAAAAAEPRPPEKPDPALWTQHVVQHQRLAMQAAAENGEDIDPIEAKRRVYGKVAGQARKLHPNADVEELIGPKPAKPKEDAPSA